MTVYKRTTGDYVRKVNKAKSNLRRNPTLAESRFINFLEKRDIPYKFQVSQYSLYGKAYIIDFEIRCTYKKFGVNVKGKMAIEIDGEAHSTPEQKEKDRVKEIDLYMLGYDKVIRIPNEATETDLDILGCFIPQIPDTYVFRELKEKLKKEYNEKRLTCFPKI